MTLMGAQLTLLGLAARWQRWQPLKMKFGPELLALKEGQPWITPMQARYLIGRDGVITHSEIVTRYEDRSSAACLLPLLRRLVDVQSTDRCRTLEGLSRSDNGGENQKHWPLGSLSSSSK